MRLWILLTLCAALATTLVLPRQPQFDYTYAVGQPWGYRTLKAPFDFEVLYPEPQVQADVQRIQAEHAPYFGLSNNISRQQKRAFQRLLDEQARISKHDAQYDDLNQNLSAYARFGQDLLDHVFTRGLADPEESALRENPGFIYILAGREERRTPISEVWTVRTAQRFFSDTLPYSALRQPEYLLPLLEKALVPNLLYSDSLTLVSKRQKLAAVRSTGVSVRKGEVLVQRGEVISADTARKLDSLANRYEAPAGPQVLAGYLILALLAYGFFYGWLALRYGPRSPEGGFAEIRTPALLGGVCVGLILLIQFSSRVGLAVPLLLPLYLLPHVVRVRAGVPVGQAVWLLVVVLAAFALDWGTAWLGIQVAGLAGRRIWPNTVGSWQLRGAATLFTALLQVAAWLGLGLAGRLPDALWRPDVMIFLLVAALFSWLVRLTDWRLGGLDESVSGRLPK